MLRNLIVSVVLGVLSSPASYGQPVLLASLRQEGGFGGTSSTARVGFVLGLFGDDVDKATLVGVDPSTTTWPYIHPAKFWDDGEIGIIELTAQNDPGFHDFAKLATDGIDGSFVTWEAWDPFPRAGHGGSESRLFGTASDLVGSTLELIRINVEDVRFLPNGPLGMEWQWQIKYEFFGSPAIPEPGTLVLLASGLLFRNFERCFGPHHPEEGLDTG